MKPAKIALWVLFAFWAAPGHAATVGLDAEHARAACTAAVALGQARGVPADRASVVREDISHLEDYLDMHARALEDMRQTTADSHAEVRAQAGRGASRTH